MGVGRIARGVLPASLRRRATGLELGEPRRAQRDLEDDEVLAGSGGLMDFACVFTAF